MTLNRRNFLKALGLGTGTSALSACGVLDNNRYYTPIEQILPYVVRPENIVPGVPSFFATTLTRGPEATTVTARHRDGRVVMVDPNRKAPGYRSVPKAALLELQRHYSPDRFRGPQAGGAPATWEDGLKQVSDAVASAKAAGKKVAWLGGYRSGTILSLIESVCDVEVHWEPLGYEAEAAAAKLVFGSDSLPQYDLSDAHYVLSFGADFLNHWGGQAMADGWAKSRDVNHGNVVARFGLVSPYRDQTGAKADDWYAVKPGSETLVARAVAGIVAKAVGYNGPALSAIGNVSSAEAAAAAGIDAARIEQIAAHFAAGHAVALPGGAAGASAQATELAAATYLLNLIGGASPSLFKTGGYAGPVHSLKDVKDLVAQLESGAIGVLFVDDVNPVHALPNLKIAEAIGKAGLSVAFTSHPDETTAACKLVLPVADMFEDWGDEEPTAGVRLLRQPTMSPLKIKYRKPGADERTEDGWDVRSVGDILLALSRAGGHEAHSAAKTWRDYLRYTWANTYYENLVLEPNRQRLRREEEAANGKPSPEPTAEEIAARPNPATVRSFADWFDLRLQDGFIELRANAGVPSVSGAGVAWTKPVAAAGTQVHIAPHAHIRDGRYANTPWAQEQPDPMTGQVWDSWVEIHPDLAGKLGVADNGAVEIKTDSGSVTLGVEVTRGVHPDVVSVQFGQGHTSNGRYATDVGVNVASLVSGAVDAYGAAVWQGTVATVTSKGTKAELVSTFGHDDDLERNFAVHVNAEQLQAAGDKTVEHPGDLTGIHHLELDKRLTDRGITDFYGLTQHPTYRFGMSVDTDACTGCGACSIACYAENNLPVVGKQKIGEGREMAWIRINRYFKQVGDIQQTHFMPMMCQQCGHAPCESVCPVLATYHNLDGLNAMIYNRCVGTRYCSNACPFSARKFNYHSYVWPEPFNLQLNPDVVTRTMGVMEKCTFCVQRIRAVKTAYKDAASDKTDFTAVVPDSALRQLPACATACPTEALVFGNLNDEKSGPSQTRTWGRNYMPLDDLNVMSAVNYLAKVSFHAPAAGHHGGGHGAAGGGDHADAKHDSPADHGAAGDHGKAADHGNAEPGHH